VQSNRVITCTKHYVCNNREWNRFDVDARLDERTLREIKLPAFKAAVREADGWSIMAAYNQTMGHYCCENRYLITDILKGEWGFSGFVVTDWGSARSTTKMAHSGLDLEMPNGKFYGDNLLQAVKSRQVQESTVDNKVKCILRIMFRAGLFDESVASYGGFADTPERKALALQVAQKSIILLKNEDQCLPLDKQSLTSIAVIGPDGDVARMFGGGSGSLNGHYGFSPLQGIREKVGNNVAVYFKRVTLKSGESKDVLFKLDKNALAFYNVKEKKWVAEPGEFEVMIGSSSRDIRLKDRFSLTDYSPNIIRKKN
jgi:beta-glucosidase